MVTLINQLEEELQKLFNSRNDEYSETIVKQKYKTIPEGYFPRVIIEEIQNREIESRSTSLGERTTALGYQINCYSRDMKNYEAVESVRQMLEIIDNYLQPPRYMLHRIGDPAIYPFISDITIMTGAVRYNCVYDYDTNLIYKS